MRFSRLLVLTFTVTSLFPVLGFTQSAPSAADTFSDKSQPRLNFGGEPMVVVQQGITSYLQYTLATLPEGASVSKATLRLFADDVDSSGEFDVSTNFRAVGARARSPI